MIPVSDIVSINPGVIDAGINPLALNGVILSASTSLPTSAPVSFTSTDAVKNYFGEQSTEYGLSQVYFKGFDGSSIKPSLLYLSAYASADRAAWLRSGTFSGYTLAQIQAIPAGVLTITVDGVAFTSSSINLAAATSFSDAAVKITAAFTGAGKPTVTWDAILTAFIITSPTAGADSTVTYCTGTASANLKFTSVTGAVISQGIDADTPDVAMDRVKNTTLNWGAFMSVFEPLQADKVLFAEWAQAQNKRFGYVAWDTAAGVLTPDNAASFGGVVKAAGYEGVLCVYNTAALAAFALGTMASINFQEENGRITFAFKRQEDFTPTVEQKSDADAVLSNLYSFYGQYGTSNDTLSFFNNGATAGDYPFFDSFINQVYLNSQLQDAAINLLLSVNAIPYNAQGYSKIKAALDAPARAGVRFGSIRSGVTLSEAQKSTANAAAGVDITGALFSQGYYIQVLDATTQVRIERGSPPINFWYCDGQAVQRISINSINIL